MQPSLQGSTVSMTGNQFLINVSKLTRLRNSKTCNVYYIYYTSIAARGGGGSFKR